MPRAKSRTRKSKNGRNGKKDQSGSSSPSGSTIMIDEKMKQTEWAKQSHTLEFAERAKMGDTTVGYKLLEFAHIIFIPLLAYGGYFYTAKPAAPTYTNTRISSLHP